jgi:predicted transcriptional regulator
MTVMNRLVDKGILKKQAQSKVYVYQAVISKEDFFRMVTRDIISAVVQNPALFSVASFTDLALDSKTMEKLKRFLKKSS